MNRGASKRQCLSGQLVEKADGVYLEFVFNNIKKKKRHLATHRASLQPWSLLTGMAMLVLATGALAQQPAETPGRAAPPSAAAGDILLNDFEAADYGGWKTAGTAFGTVPAKGTLGGQQEVSGFEGKGLVNSYLGGDGPTGKLTSPAFTIERDYITFLIGGGYFQGKTCMNLLVDGKVVLSTTGSSILSGGNETLHWGN